ncbi:serine/threonine-protein kinase [Streptomyces griseoaurantiacus]|uniref:non-specific serine/threonine protein kinase n=2 Tax=Streptomyces TaxID=1883 RepID=A0A1G7F5W2_9ACTN|nr:serine/threonine-protein kinase [Streptomyces jietaisiensis]SDE71294.1 serine/threonine protein kinase [Streptomyces jietaisiensis]
MGEVFAGRYELADPIGRGGVGAVWRAWDHRRRRYVAAKVLQQRDAHALLRFVREQALRIDHPHVLAPASWAADDDKVLFTMDLVAGGSLVHLVGDYGPLPPAFVCTLLDQLLSGLAAVHAEDVIHRDIKPANILLEATGTGRPRLRLSDFGIAMRLGEPRLTETDYVVGTPGYLAPEQVLGSEPDFPADLFAVGLVALYLLQGAKPDAQALVDLFTAHGTPRAPRGVPDPLWQVVAGLLQPDPSARFRTATGARKALAAAVELLPAPGEDDPDERIEIFDQLGPLPEGFGPQGPTRQAVRPPGRTSAGRPEHLGGGTPTGGSERPGNGGFGGGPGNGGFGGGPGSDRFGGGPGSGTDSGPGTGRSAFGVSASGVHASGSGALGATPGVGGPGPTASAPGPTASAPAPARPLVPPLPSLPPPPLPAPGAADPATPPPTAPDAAARRVPPPPAEAPDPSPPPQSPQPQPSQPPPPDGMSDTGSFHLPPPQPRPYAPEPAPRHPAPAPAYVPPLHGTTPGPASGAVRVHQAHGLVLGAPSTVPSAPPAQRSPAARGSVRHGRRAARRPGPPARIAVPVLLLALVCYAVGFWALTRI